MVYKITCTLNIHVLFYILSSEIISATAKRVTIKRPNVLDAPVCPFICYQNFVLSLFVSSKFFSTNVSLFILGGSGEALCN